MCDRTYAREVPTEEGVALAQQFGCDFLEASAKTVQNLEPLFANLVRNLRQNAIVGPIPGSAKGKEKKKNRCLILQGLFTYVVGHM